MRDAGPIFQNSRSSRFCLPRRDFLRLLLAALPASLVPGWVREASAGNVPRSPDPRLLSSYVRFIKRSEWAQIRPRPAQLRPAAPYTRLTIHHAGTHVSTATAPKLVMRDLRRIHASHLQLNYGDIGYHFIIDYAGCVWEGRSVAYEGAHVSGWNEGNLGVMVLGNFEKQRPSPSQLWTLSQLTGMLAACYRIPPAQIYGHRDLGHTVCPGRNLYPYVRSLKQSIAPNSP